MKYQFCKCGNCGEVFFDTNPGTQPFFEIPSGKTFRNLTHQKDCDGYFSGCPTCKTDGYLEDVMRVEDIKNVLMDGGKNNKEYILSAAQTILAANEQLARRMFVRMLRKGHMIFHPDDFTLVACSEVEDD